MFNFQKEVILNSLDKVDVVDVTEKGAGKPKIEKKVRIPGGGEYFAKYIVEKKIYKTQPINGKNFELRIHPDTDLQDKHVQILIELGLDGDYRGDYGSALYYFRKPILVDVVLPNSRRGAADALAKAIQAAVPSEYEFVDASHNYNNDEDAVIKGMDSYQKVRRVVISIYTCDERCEGNSEELMTFMDLSGKALETESACKVGEKRYITYTPNNVEFGTYNYVLHNLRLPTYANLRFTSPMAPEMPVPGATYVQFTFAYCVPRGVHFGGLSVAGQTNHSTTLHTFYVLSTLAEAFQDKFTENSFGLTDNDFVELGRDNKVHNITVLPDAFASAQDIAVAAGLDANTKADKTLEQEVTEARGGKANLKAALEAKQDKSEAA